MLRKQRDPETDDYYIILLPDSFLENGSIVIAVFTGTGW